MTRHRSIRSLLGLALAYCLAVQTIVVGLGGPMPAVGGDAPWPVWCRPGVLLGAETAPAGPDAPAAPAADGHDLSCILTCAAGAAPAVVAASASGPAVGPAGHRAGRIAHAHLLLPRGRKGLVAAPRGPPLFV
ncbi:hypothetical protein QNA08_16515 [Chelatococcus sp. SYSU_G07232]|uniref:DUF2946 domain-containing protein n=1 Tax=Chelatococcus albus TaxID=3047466 RepID=A0ABT7AKD6_9HYPH|nr:hypothetical protein [Chelatococcus sp. SYSU_G07232]MDJ1159824.1 hypothetical protein [Chelatococcus sp. SYSU_G07232]